MDRAICAAMGGYASGEKVATERERERDRWVQIRTRHTADRIDHGHDH